MRSHLSRSPFPPAIPQSWVVLTGRDKRGHGREKGHGWKWSAEWREVEDRIGLGKSLSLCQPYGFVPTSNFGSRQRIRGMLMKGLQDESELGKWRKRWDVKVRSSAYLRGRTLILCHDIWCVLFLSFSVCPCAGKIHFWNTYFHDWQQGCEYNSWFKQMEIFPHLHHRTLMCCDIT